jgi:hypothetical protein
MGARSAARNMILKGEKGTGLNFERYLVLLQKFPEREREV